jgi:hypothetical protein
MKSEEINRRIAEACGTDNRWTVMKCGLYYRPNAKGYTNRKDEAWIMTEAEADKETYPYDEPVTKHRLPAPPYCTDLNAMHEAEKIFDSRTSDEQSLYYDYLSLVVGWKGKTQAEARWEAAWNCLRATPAQKAKAFLMTIGKWEE